MADGPDQHPILAADADRERSVALLREAVGEGRLTLDEFSDRVAQAQVARSDQDLNTLVRDLPPAQVPAAPIPEPSRHSAVCSHLVRQGHWELAPRSAYRSIFGTIDLDLRQATLAAGDAEMRVFNLFGTVTVIVPEGIAVNVEGGGMFASQVIDSPQTPPLPGAPRLRIVVSGPGGTLRVRSRPARKSLLGSGL